MKTTRVSSFREALTTIKLYVQQQWDPRMLSLAFDVVDDTAIAVQQDLHNFERHLLALQLRKPQRQTPITSYFQLSSSTAGAGGAGGVGGVGGGGGRRGGGAARQ